MAKTSRTCGSLQGRVRLVESRQRGFLPRQETLPVLRVRAQLLRLVESGVQRLRAELPRGLLVLLGRGEAAGQRGHERGGERHALRQPLRQAGAEAALQAGQRRVRVGARGEGRLQSRRGRRGRLEHHRPVRHEHRVPGVHEVSRAGLRGAPDQRVDAEGGGASEWPLHHHEGGAERRAHMNDRRSSAEEAGREARCSGGAAGVTGSLLELTEAAARSSMRIPSVRAWGEKFQKHQRIAPSHTSAPRARLQTGRVPRGSTSSASRVSGAH